MKKIIGTLLFLIIICFSFWYICPFFNDFPHPTGSYWVGYTQINWYDESLLKEVNIEIFYPSIRSKYEEIKFSYQV